jgi:hypothetical protein
MYHVFLFICVNVVMSHVFAFVDIKRNLQIYRRDNMNRFMLNLAIAVISLSENMSDLPLCHFLDSRVLGCIELDNSILKNYIL